MIVLLVNVCAGYTPFSFYVCVYIYRTFTRNPFSDPKVMSILLIPWSLCLNMELGVNDNT